MIEWDGLDPDNQKIGGLPLTSRIPTPGELGGAYLTFGAAGMVLAGPPREVSKKGIYKTIMRISTNNVINGTYSWFWKVV